MTIGTVFQQWLRTMGDPDLVDWISTFLYFAAAWRCQAAAAMCWESGQIPFWRCASYALIALGINKQLDLQTLLLAVGRYTAHVCGWYGSRRPAELAFLAVVLIAGFSMFAAVVWHSRGRQLRWLALAGFTLIGLFVAARAGRILHFDAVSPFSTYVLHVMMELTGILVILVAADMTVRQTMRRETTSSVRNAETQSAPPDR